MALYDLNGNKIAMYDFSTYLNYTKVKFIGTAVIGITAGLDNTYFYSGEIADWSNVQVFTTNEIGNLIEDVTNDCIFSPASGETLTNDIASLQIVYNDFSISIPIEVETKPASFDEATWSQISKATKTGKIGEFAAVGDIKTITFDDYYCRFILASINNDENQYYPKNTIDLISKDLWSQTKYSNNTNGGWRDSYLRDYLSSKVYIHFPDDLKNVIIEKKHLHSCGPTSDVNVSDWYEISDKIWAPTAYELGGSNIYSPNENSTNNKQYFSSIPLFVTMKTGSSYYYYWTSSIGTTSNKALRVSNSSPANIAEYTSSGTGMKACFGIRIG